MGSAIESIFFLSLLVNCQVKGPEKRLEASGLHLQVNSQLQGIKEGLGKAIAFVTIPHYQIDQIPMGEWEITNLTGSITSKGSGPEPPVGICENFEETYEAISEYSFMELKMLDSPQMDAARQVNNIMTDFKGMIANKPVVDASRSFVFHFEFDNGYHSNEMLQQANRYIWPKVALRIDQQDYGKILGKLAEAFGGIEGYHGSWHSDGETVYPGSSVQIVGIEGLQSGGGETGKSLFWVTGKFDSPRKMSGEWEYTEESQLYECTTISSGKGKWEAEPQD